MGSSSLVGGRQGPQTAHDDFSIPRGNTTLGTQLFPLLRFLFVGCTSLKPTPVPCQSRSGFSLFTAVSHSFGSKVSGDSPGRSEERQGQQVTEASSPPSLLRASSLRGGPTGLSKASRNGAFHGHRRVRFGFKEIISAPGPGRCNHGNLESLAVKLGPSVRDSGDPASGAAPPRT